MLQLIITFMVSIIIFALASNCLLLLIVISVCRTIFPPFFRGGADRSNR